MAHDQPLEKWLKTNGYAFKFTPNFPLDQIDLDEAAANPARMGRSLDSDLAYEYAQAYEDGADFPAILVREIVGQALKQLCGGMHRCHGSFAAKKDRHDAIVVRESDPARVDLMMRVANSKGVGRGETLNGKLHHIAELRRLYSHFKIDDLAKHFSVKRTAAQMYLRVTASEQRAERLGLGAFFASSKMSNALKVELNALQSDHVFHETSRLIQAHLPVLKGETGVDLVRTLRDAGTERKAISIIADRDKELIEADDERKTKGRRTPSAKLTKYFSHIHSLVRTYPGTPQKLYLAGLGTCATMKRELKMVCQSQDILTDLKLELERQIAESEKAAEWTEKTRGEANLEKL
jgi:hypothetical protein